MAGDASELKLLQDILDQTTSVVFLKDRDGRYLLINRRYEELFQVKREEFVGKTDLDLFPVETVERLRANDREVLEQDRAIEFDEVVPNQGEPRQYISVKFPLRDGSGRVIGTAGIATDVTERNRERKALEQSERRLADSQRVAGIGSFEQDIETGDTWWSESHYQIFGEPPDSQRSPWEVARERIHPEDLERVTQYVLRARDQDTYEVEYRLLMPDGALKHLYTWAAAVRQARFQKGWLGVSQDITRRRQAELVAERLRLHNEGILESAGEGIYGLDLEGNTSFVNPAAASMLGWRREELIGRGQHGVIHHTRADGTPYPVEACAIHAAIRDGAVHQVDDEVFWRKDGTSFPVQYTSTPLRDREGRTSGAVVVFQDISERRATEARLRRAERLASIGTLAAGVAHEINNPLGSILAAAEFALMRLEDSGSVKESLEGIVQDALRAGRIVRGVLRFAQDQGSERRREDLNRLLQRVRDFMRKRIDQCGAELVLELDESLPEILINQTEIEQVIVNLIENALDLRARRIAVSTEAIGGCVRIRVSDDGPGMSEEVREQVFDPFFTTRTEQGGTGLGLSIAHGIVIDHGGSIDVTSRAGAGTTLSVLLPMG